MHACGAKEEDKSDEGEKGEDTRKAWQGVREEWAKLVASSEHRQTRNCAAAEELRFDYLK